MEWGRWSFTTVFPTNSRMVKGLSHPQSCPQLMGIARSSWFHVASFEVCALIILCDIIANICGQPRPIVVAFNQSLGFLVTWVSGNREVILEGDNSHMEAFLVWDIHPPSGVIQETIMFFTYSLSAIG